MISKEIKGLSKKSKDFQRNQMFFKEFQRNQRIHEEIKRFFKKSKDF